MKRIIIFTTVCLISISVFGKEETNEVAISEWYSTHPQSTLEDFKAVCESKVEMINQKMERLENKYDEIQTGDFNVEIDLHLFRYRQNRRRRYGYSCDAIVENKNTLYGTYKEYSKMLIHLSRKNHKTACIKILNENLKNKEVIFQEMVLEKSLIQGRLCYVYSVELAKTID
jgi:hypothetical protein